MTLRLRLEGVIIFGDSFCHLSRGMIRTLHMEVENQTHDKLSWDIDSDVEKQSVAVGFIE